MSQRSRRRIGTRSTTARHSPSTSASLPVHSTYSSSSPSNQTEAAQVDMPTSAGTSGTTPSTSNSAPLPWFQKAMSHLTSELAASRRATQEAVAQTEALQREVASLKRASQSSGTAPKQKFVSPGIERQYSSNQSILAKMHSALETLPPSAADAKELLEESKSELQLRQKHLRIADQHGWTAVQIYSQGRLGDSAEDEKLIAAAATAARKIQQPFRLAGRGRNTVMRGEPRSGFNTFFPRSNFNNADTGPYPMCMGSGSHIAPWQRNAPLPTAAGATNTGRCYLCSGVGHFARQCPAYSSRTRAPRGTAATRFANPSTDHADTPWRITPSATHAEPRQL